MERKVSNGDSLKSTVIQQLQRELGWHLHHAHVGVEARFKCEYCGRDLLASVEDYDAWQLDHIIPTSGGGDDSIENKALTCKACNFMKRTFVPEGETRNERIASARAHIKKRRENKEQELYKVRRLAGYVGSGDA
jgi:CRISPR/Cas system Type II protein with McrA/HNH and RuvC-like nuclease domain